MRSAIAFFLAAAPAVMAETHTIVLTSELTFDPEVTEAKSGDILEFQFQPQNHSVIMGDLEGEACAPVSGGFFSGFMPVESGVGSDVFQVTLADDSPIIFYCGKGNHCAQGMIGGVNIDADTLSSYKEAATSATVVVPEDGVSGGEVVSLGSSGGSETGSKTSGAPPAATSAEKKGAAGSVRVGLGGFAAAIGVALLMA